MYRAISWARAGAKFRRQGRHMMNVSARSWLKCVRRARSTQRVPSTQRAAESGPLWRLNPARQTPRQVMASASSGSSRSTFSQARTVSSLFDWLDAKKFGTMAWHQVSQRRGMRYSAWRRQSSFSGTSGWDCGCRRRKASMCSNRAAAAASAPSERHLLVTVSTCPRSRMVRVISTGQGLPGSYCRPASSRLPMITRSAGGRVSLPLPRTRPTRARSTSLNNSLGYCRSNTTAQGCSSNRRRSALLHVGREGVAQLVAAAVGKRRDAHREALANLGVGPQHGQHLLANRRGEEGPIGGDRHLFRQLHLPAGHLHKADRGRFFFGHHVQQVIGPGEFAQNDGILGVSLAAQRDAVLVEYRGQRLPIDQLQKTLIADLDDQQFFQIPADRLRSGRRILGGRAVVGRDHGQREQSGGRRRPRRHALPRPVPRQAVPSTP